MKRLSKGNTGKIAAFILLLNYSSSLSAQTYNHESAIMNQPGALPLENIIISRIRTTKSQPPLPTSKVSVPRRSRI